MKTRIKSMIWNIRNRKHHAEQQEKRIPKSEDSISSRWDNFKHSNILLKGSQKEKGKSKKLETYLKK